MPKKSNLNGTPGNLAASYLSTMHYYRGGYRADWIFRIAERHNTYQLRIDVMKDTFEPKHFEVEALSIDLGDLKRILHNELTEQGFELDFILEVILDFKMAKYEDERRVDCYPYMIDKEGCTYRPKRVISEVAYDINLM